MIKVVFSARCVNDVHFLPLFVDFVDYTIYRHPDLCTGVTSNFSRSGLRAGPHGITGDDRLRNEAEPAEPICNRLLAGDGILGDLADCERGPSGHDGLTITLALIQCEYVCRAARPCALAPVT